MKSLILILNVVIFLSQSAYSQSETAESQAAPNAMQELVTRSQSSDPSVTAIYGGEFAFNQVPALLDSFFQDADCTFDRGTPAGMMLPFIAEENRVRPTESQGHMVCQMRYGPTNGGKNFTLCQHQSITCNSIVGGLKKDNVMYAVPDGQKCDSISAREALQTSFSSEYGGYNVIPASN